MIARTALPDFRPNEQIVFGIAEDGVTEVQIGSRAWLLMCSALGPEAALRVLAQRCAEQLWSQYLP